MSVRPTDISKQEYTYFLEYLRFLIFNRSLREFGSLHKSLISCYLGHVFPFPILMK